MSKFSNPFTKNPFGTTNSALFDPSKSDTSVITNQPIATQNLMSAQQSSLNFPKSQAQRDFETRRLLFGNRISDENLDSKQKKKKLVEQKN